MRGTRGRLLLLGLAAALVGNACSLEDSGTPEQAYDQAILADGPLGYYPLDESSGTVAHDKSPGANHGTLKGGVELGVKAGRPNQAMQFDGKSGEIETTLKQSNVTAYTVEVWLNTVDSPSGFGKALVEGRGPGSGGGRGLTLGFGGDAVGAGGRPFFALDADFVLTGVYSPLEVNDGRWHQLVGTWTSQPGAPVDPAQFALYIDGEPTATTPIALGDPLSPPLYGAGTIRVGRHEAWDTYYNGILARVAIYPAALTSAQIREHYRRATAS